MSRNFFVKFILIAAFLILAWLIFKFNLIITLYDDTKLLILHVGTIIISISVLSVAGIITIASVVLKSGFITTVYSAVSSWINQFGGIATGLDYLRRGVGFLWKKDKIKQVKFKNAAEFELHYRNHIREYLDPISYSIEGNNGNAINDFSNTIENSSFRLSMSDNTFANDGTQSVLEPEKLIQMDQASLQYRIMEIPSKLVLDQNHRHYLLVAPLGSGKTLYLKKMALFAADSALDASKSVSIPSDITSYFPIYVNLIKFSQSKYMKKIIKKNLTDNEKVEKALFKFLVKEWHITFSIVKSLLDEKEKVLFLLDGLDQLPNKADMNTFIKTITNKGNPRFYFIVAKRANSEKENELFPGFGKPALENFCLEDIYRFIAHWNPQNPAHEISGENRKALAALIENHPRFQAFASMPPILPQMVANKHNIPMDKLFLHRIHIYKIVTERLLEHWNMPDIPTKGGFLRHITKATIHLLKKFKFHSTTDNADRQKGSPDRILLEYLAWKMHVTGHYKKTKQSIEEIFDEALNKKLAGLSMLQNLQESDKKKVYENLILTNGLLREDIKDREHYRFLCMPLQEYLASQFLIKNPASITKEFADTKEFIEKKCTDIWWEEVLLLYIAGTATNQDALIPVNELIQWVTDASPGDAFLTKPIFAGRVLAMYQEDNTPLIPDNQRQDIGDTLCRLLKNAPRRHVREKIGWILADLGVVELSHDDVERLSLGVSIPEERTLHPLLLPYLVNIPTGQDYVYNLQNKDSAAIEAALKEITRQIGKPEIGVDLVCALGVLGRRDLAPVLYELLVLNNDDIAFSIKASIVQVLGIIGNWNQLQKLTLLLPKARRIPSGYEPKLELQIKWLIVSSLGVSGRRLGFWGKAEENGPEIHLYNQLKACTVGHVDYDEEILWNIAITLSTSFFARLVKNAGNIDEFELGYWVFNGNEIAERGTSVLRKINDKALVRSRLNELVEMVKAYSDWVSKWLFLCEEVWQLADIMEIITNLKGKIDSLCKARPDCSKRATCQKLVAANSCLSPYLLENMSYAKFIVEQRVEANANINDTMS